MAGLETARTTRLKAVLDGALAGLDGVEPKRLFGCDGWFVRGNLFALVFKEGRLGLRFRDEAVRDELLALPGAEAWRMGSRLMRFWVLLPSALPGRPARLRGWARRAWQEAIARPPRPWAGNAAEAGSQGSKRIRPAFFKRLS